MSGKKTISCLGGPEGILGSLAKRIADCEKAFLAGIEARCMEGIVRMVRGTRVLIIFNKRRMVGRRYKNDEIDAWR